MKIYLINLLLSFKLFLKNVNKNKIGLLAKINLQKDWLKAKKI